MFEGRRRPALWVKKEKQRLRKAAAPRARATRHAVRGAGRAKERASERERERRGVRAPPFRRRCTLLPHERAARPCSCPPPPNKSATVWVCVRARAAAAGPPPFLKPLLQMSAQKTARRSPYDSSPHSFAPFFRFCFSSFLLLPSITARRPPPPVFFCLPRGLSGRRRRAAPIKQPPSSFPTPPKRKEKATSHCVCVVLYCAPVLLFRCVRGAVASFLLPFGNSPPYPLFSASF